MLELIILNWWNNYGMKKKMQLITKEQLVVSFFIFQMSQKKQKFPRQTTKNVIT